jgi:C4-dicarboxylate-specific signal transduction histidine kinase
LSPQAKKQNVSLQLCSPKEVVYLKGEQGKLLQIITNLVTNAMDAVADCSQQQVEIQWCVKDSKRLNGDDKFVFISIKDTGMGISDAVKKDMFNAFYTTKKTGNGLGLGLFIVSTLLNDFKGTIQLKDNTIGSQYYKTVFELRLPLIDLTKN